MANVDERRVVLVTGASSGLGWAIAERLSRQGLRVYGTSRRGPAAKMPETVLAVALDVRSEQSVRTCIDQVIDDAGRIDILVNNAAQYLVGVLEETAEPEARSLFDTNFWGVVRMVNAVLPHMRTRRSGRIINIGSVTGMHAVPAVGHYSASKHAVAGYSEALRYEVAHLGIAVSLIVPSDFRTNLYRSADRAAQRISEYDAVRKPIEDWIDRVEQLGEDPRIVAELVASVVFAKQPERQYFVGTLGKRLPQLRRWLPQAVFERSFRRRIGLP